MSDTDKCQIRQGDYYLCKCDGVYPHAPGWLADTEVYAPVTDPAAFDHRDRLNDDGTVTLRMTPSAWHGYNISPDTYQTVNGDSWVESELEYLNEGGDEGYSLLGKALDGLVAQHPITLDYDHFDWTYDHAAIVGDFSGELANWMAETLAEIGLSCSVSVRDTWSPKEYNFTSDGFEVDLTCDPAKLRALTEDFDVDAWGHEHYRSYDGFMSFVTSRLNDDEWHAEYDGGFRVESLLLAHDPCREREWVMWLLEAEQEVYMQHTTVVPDEDRIRESILAEYGYMESGLTLLELEEWAASLAPSQPEVLFSS